MSEIQHNKEQNWFYEHRYLSNLILVLISSLLTFLVFEFGLRLSGKKPGYVPRYANFKLVNQLEVYQKFLTDREGVFKANPNYEWPENEYIQINSDGFRSMEFKRYETTRTKILFLGDSHTWGASAKPITNSFVDIVSRQGYLTFNTGIAGTGPNQYAYLAQKYVPLLKPDIVAVMFSMANDLGPANPMLAHKNPWHVTNAGWIRGFDENGNYMSPQDAYDYYLAEDNAAYVKDTSNSLRGAVQQIFMRSVIGTYTWVGLGLGKPRLTHFEKKGDVQVQNTQEYLSRIKTVSEKYGARFMLFLIPAHPEIKNKSNSIEDNLHIFEDYDPFIPDFLTRYDYTDLPDRHLSNLGHRKYAEFIIRILESESR